MVREYELVYIVRPDLDDQAVFQASQTVKALVESLGGSVEKSVAWGKRRLAYEVKHFKDGYYIVSRIRLDSTKVRELERSLHISDTVFRHLVVLPEGLGELAGEEYRAATVSRSSAEAAADEEFEESETDDEYEIPAAAEDEVAQEV